ncbi:hypothetical protein [Streptomyces lavendulocolor]|uniref:hypothetical protein n=1 Tax=Streptomyces lavendulocolor TaxID=67316 RepID=UPI003C2B618F
MPIEQDAYAVILLDRPEAYEKESERGGETDLTIDKHLPGDVFGAIVATVVINETPGEVAGITASAKCAARAPAARHGLRARHRRVRHRRRGVAPLLISGVERAPGM